MIRIIPVVLVLAVLTWPAWSGTYTMDFTLPDQVLPFDTFGFPPATVLAPAGVYKGFSDSTVIEILSGNLVASNPTGGAAREYSIVGLVPDPPATSFSGGAVVRCIITGATISGVRDGTYPGLAVGLSMVDAASGAYFFAVINRTTAGADYFDTITPGGMVNRNLLTPGTGYFAVWETNAMTTATVLAVQAIPAGSIGDTEFRIEFDSGALASYSINGTPLLSAHQLAAQPIRFGTLNMSWGTPTGNPGYTGVTFSRFRASGPEVPDGGIAALPALGLVAIGVLACLVLSLGSLRLRKTR